jgi:Fe-S-cluster containining protein
MVLIMICLRCGYCCINYDVIIVDNPKLGLIDSNTLHKPSGEKCKHLAGNNPGEYYCGIHHYPWYGETPCAAYGQVESKITDNCRMGAYVLARLQTNI